jgi:hypothetical protein
MSATDASAAATGSPPITETLIRFTGAIFTDRDLERGTPVHITVTLDNGDTIANGYGQVELVADKDVYKKVEGERVLDHAERVHTAKVS